MSNEHIIHLENGRFADDTPATKVREILDNAISEAPKGGIAVHFHGGLVNQDKAMEIAGRLEHVYEEGAAYPIFFVWESGLTETLKNNFGELAGERLFRLLFKRLRKIVKRKFKQTAGRRAARVLADIDTYEEDQAIDRAIDSLDRREMPPEDQAPKDLNELNQDEEMSLEAELEADPQLRAELEAVSNGLLADVEVEPNVRSRAPTVRASSMTLMDPKALEKYVEQRAAGARGVIEIAKFVKGVIVIAKRIIERFVAGRDHGLHATVVEELLREFYVANIGQVIWSTMKQDTQDSFGPDPAVHGGTAFLHAVKESVSTGDSAPRITLIGHSAGAIYVCHLLKAVDELGLPEALKFDVIFLAPASTFALTASTLTDHQDRVRNFRMFTMTDTNEKEDELVSVLYPHSLLYFISGVLEENADAPITGMERFYRGVQYEAADFPKVEQVRQFVSASDDRAVWSIENRGPGLATKSLKHGDFDNDTDTLNSLKHILASGFYE